MFALTAFKDNQYETVTIKAVIIFISLLYWNIAVSDTIQKCVDAKGAVTFADRCPTNQQATDTGVLIDSRSEKQKADDDASMQKYLEDLDKQSKITPTATAVPVAQPSTVDTNATQAETSDDDNENYECLSTSRNCLGYRGSNLTPAQKAALLQKIQAQQLPARIKRR